jgi:hypothetical protein
MSTVNNEKAFDRAVDLVINQDRVVQEWGRRYVAIQASLALAAAALLAWKGLLGVIVIPLGVIPIILAKAMGQIMRREYDWQKTYVEMVKRTEGNEPLLYQEAGTHTRSQGKDIAGTLRGITVWVIAAWGIVIALWLISHLA